VAPAIVPRGTAIRTEKTSVVRARDAVGSRRCRMRSVTGIFEKIEIPRSPFRREPAQMKNWVTKG
jgi:hypothetical protein